MEDTCNVVCAILGLNEIVYVPLRNDRIHNALGFFKKKNGKFSDLYLEDLPTAINETDPICAIGFKSKQSINSLIRFLRYYRDNIYKTQRRSKKQCGKE